MKGKQCVCFEDMMGRELVDLISPLVRVVAFLVFLIALRVILSVVVNWFTLID